MTIWGNEVRAANYSVGGFPGLGGDSYFAGEDDKVGAIGSVGSPSNAGTGIGGGIAAQSGDLTLTHVTIARNSASGGQKASGQLESSIGGGLHSVGTTSLWNSLIAENTSREQDVYGTLISRGHNLIATYDDRQWLPSDLVGKKNEPIDARLGGLVEVGGVPTVSLLSDSPASECWR